MDAVWTNGAYVSLHTRPDASTSACEAMTEARLYGDGGTPYMTFTITSVTDTGFTITWTETGSFNPDDSAFVWEAEGEL